MKGWETCICDLCGTEVLNTPDGRVKHITARHVEKILQQLAAELLPPITIPGPGRRRKARRRK